MTQAAYPHAMTSYVPVASVPQGWQAPVAPAPVVQAPLVQAPVAAVPMAAGYQMPADQLVLSSPIAYAPAVPVPPAVVTPSIVTAPVVTVPVADPPATPGLAGLFERLDAMVDRILSPDKSPQPAQKPAPTQKKPEAPKAEPKPSASKPKTKTEKKPEKPAEKKPEKKSEKTEKQAERKAATYAVKSGDTLSSIAKATLGDASRWRELYDLNKSAIGANPNVLRVGLTLKLPSGAKAAGASAEKSGKLPVMNKDKFISQYKSIYNTNEDAPRNGNCGPTSLTMIAEAFGKITVTPATANKAIEETRRRMGAGTTQASEYNGTSFAQLQKGAASYGLKSKVVWGSIDAIKKELQAGRLVIAHVRPDYLFPGTTSGHYTVVTKIENGKVYMHDPANTKGPMVLSEAAFKKAQAGRGTWGLISVWA